MPEPYLIKFRVFGKLHKGERATIGKSPTVCRALKSGTSDPLVGVVKKRFGNQHGRYAWVQVVRGAYLLGHIDPWLTEISVSYC